MKIVSFEHPYIVNVFFGVADRDPNPDPPNPHVFGPPGSGSTSERYGSGSGSESGSGSGSFYHHAKIVQFSGHEPIYFIENKEKTLRASYDRDTQIVDYMQ